MDVQTFEAEVRRNRRGPRLMLALVVVLVGAGVTLWGMAARDPGAEGVGGSNVGEPSKPQAEAQKVEDAYRSYWAANLKAGEIPDPSSPLLAAYATGSVLEAAVSDLEKLRREGHAIRQVPNSVARSMVTVASVEGGKASLTDCSVADGIVVRTDTGNPAFDYPPGFATTTLFSADMVLESGTWKVASLTRAQRWDGVAGCAVTRP